MIARSSAGPDDASAQIDLMSVPWLMIGEEPSAIPIGGYLRARQMRLSSQGVLIAITLAGHAVASADTEPALSPL